MAELLLAWWTATQRAGADERGTTVVELMMVVALCVAAAVLVATLGATFAGDTI